MKTFTVLLSALLLTVSPAIAGDEEEVVEDVVAVEEVEAEEADTDDEDDG